MRQLDKINCSRWKKNNAKKIMLSINEGFTFTNFKKRTSIVGISAASNRGQWYSTLVHELKHVLSHICEYYNVSESGEDAAYLIGYLMQQIIKNK